MTLYKWSQTAASDATADSTINWSEGQAPSTVNDSARAMMAATAKYRDDISGAIQTSGTSTAYTVSSYQGFDSFAHMDGQIIAFTPNITNSGSCTINVDSLGVRNLRCAPGVELLAGTIIQGTPYVAVYSNATGAFYLHGFYGNPYNIPLAAGLDFWGSTTPNSSFAFPTGQAISRTAYSALYALIGTTYGTGDGTTTFNLPDKTGRGSVMKEASATRLTSTYFGGNSTVLGAVGGAESHTLSLGELPTGITTGGSNSISVTSTSSTVHSGGNVDNYASVGGGTGGVYSSIVRGAITSTGSNTITATSNNTSGGAHAVVQPTIVCNYILRII